MNKANTSFLLFVLLIACSGCSTVSSTTSEEPNSYPASSSRVAFTETVSSFGKVTLQCPVPYRDVFARLEGALLLDKIGSSNRLFFGRTETNSSDEEKFVELGRSYTEISQEVVLSPGGEWFAYISRDNPDSIVVSSQDWASRIQIPLFGQWAYLIDWLDDEVLLLELGDSEGVSRTTLLNPFTMESEEVSLGFLDLYEFSPNIGWGTYWKIRTILDPQQERVIYPSYVQDLATGGDTGVLLEDLREKRTLVAIQGADLLSYAPQWSQDGNEFILSLATGIESSGEELFAVSRDGVIQQISNLIAFSTSQKLALLHGPQMGTKLHFGWLQSPSLQSAFCRKTIHIHLSLLL